MKVFLYIFSLILIFISPFLGEVNIEISSIFSLENSLNMV
ncbi:iron ABC transporter permease, partial [Aliarcobacter skirrowii]